MAIGSEINNGDIDNATIKEVSSMIDYDCLRFTSLVEQSFFTHNYLHGSLKSMHISILTNS